METSQVQALAAAITGQLDSVLAGKSSVTRSAVLVFLCGGHLLIEDVPGVGKTTLAKALARATGGAFSRIQFTPDLLPSDVTGGAVLNQREGTFEFRPGPVFANVLLADEINRATPKTQSSLLEAMEERTVTADGAEHALPHPFLVIATQNNVEMTGTFPLPEAQMDRFFGRLSIGYPDRDAEQRMLERQKSAKPLDDVVAVCTTEELTAAQRRITEVFVDAKVQQYIVELVRATRSSGNVALGASPRASLHLQHAAQAEAILNGRDFTTPDDVKAIAVMVLAHRLVPRGEFRARGLSSEEVVRQLLESVPAPVPTR